jgi:hypothetical protein
MSQKAVYAVGMELTPTYADGSQGKPSSQGVDLLALYISNAELPLALRTKTNSLLRPGETHIETVEVPVGKDGLAPVGVSGTVTAVVLEDRTALGDGATVQSFLTHRDFQARLYSAVLDDLRAAAASVDPLKAVEARQQDILAGRASDVSAEVASMRAQTLRMVMSGLKAGGAAAIGREIENYRVRAEETARHATLAGGAK